MARFPFSPIATHNENGFTFTRTILSWPSARLKRCISPCKKPHLSHFTAGSIVVTTWPSISQFTTGQMCSGNLIGSWSKMRGRRPTHMNQWNRNLFEAASVRWTDSTWTHSTESFREPLVSVRSFCFSMPERLRNVANTFANCV